MVHRLVAAVVLVLLGVTPSLALACDARCLPEHAFTSSPSSQTASHSNGLAHTHHHTTSATAHAHRHDLGAATTAHGMQVTDAHTARHGCQAAFDAGTLDRQTGAAHLAAAPSSTAIAHLSPCPAPLVARVSSTPPLPLALVASVPLRI